MTELTKDFFQGHVGDVFALAEVDPPFELTLAFVREVDSGPAFESFSVMFRGTGESVLPQATYRMERGGEGFDIFIVPVGRDADGVSYEAVFNRLRGAGDAREA